jgi:Flp pilus assembly protein TadG
MTEFALIVPIFFLVVFAILAFGRAYQRLNVLTGALRDGSRYGSTLGTLALDPCSGYTATIQGRVVNYASAFGVTLNPASILVTCPGGTDVSVGVQNYALFSDLNFFGLSTRTVTRTATFRWERAP